MVCPLLTMNSYQPQHISQNLWLMCFLFFTLGACQPESGSPGKSVLPDVSPESIASNWLDHYHHNRFEQAKALSTQETRIKIDALAKFIYKGATEPVIEISNIRCSQLPDSTCTCYYLLNDSELGPIHDSLFLTKNGSSWLVSLPARNETDAPGVPLESIMDSVNRELQ